MTDNIEDIAREALALAEKATPGPWWTRNDEVCCAGARTFEGERSTRRLCDFHWADTDTKRDDAAFTAFARTALPLLARAVLDDH